MSRMNGERIQEYEARRRWQFESAVATKAKEVQYEMMRRNGVPLPVVEWPMSCTCWLRPYPHLHSAEERRRFERRMPPGDEALYEPHHQR